MIVSYASWSRRGGGGRVGNGKRTMLKSQVKKLPMRLKMAKTLHTMVASVVQKETS